MRFHQGMPAFAGSRPSHLEPSTMSASPSSMTRQRFGMIAGSYWRSGCSMTTADQCELAVWNRIRSYRHSLGDEVDSQQQRSKGCRPQVGDERHVDRDVRNAEQDGRGLRPAELGPARKVGHRKAGDDQKREVVKVLVRAQHE